MSSKLSYKVSYYVLYAMFALILVVLGLFYFGGDATGAAALSGVDPEMWQPANTDALLYLMYALFGLAHGHPDAHAADGQNDQRCAAEHPVPAAGADSHRDRDADRRGSQEARLIRFRLPFFAGGEFFSFGRA